MGVHKYNYGKHCKQPWQGRSHQDLSPKEAYNTANQIQIKSGQDIIDMFKELDTGDVFRNKSHLLTAEQVKELAKEMVESAVHKDNAAFVVPLFCNLLEIQKFAESVNECFESKLDELILIVGEEKKLSNFGANYISTIISIKWPTQHLLLSQEVGTIVENLIVYDAVATIKGWVDEVKVLSLIHLHEELSEENRTILNNCLRCIIHLFNACNEKIWIRRYDIYEYIASVIKPSLVKRNHVDKDVKQQLLKVGFKMGELTRKIQSKYVDSECQSEL
uniref:tRNA exportin n=1 Tax=Rhabditophanes sp. KR3021 TaxID=114890 RepID=A0AC35UGF4_9BILA